MTELREALAIELDSSVPSIAGLGQHESWSHTLPEFEKHVKHLSQGSDNHLRFYLVLKTESCQIGASVCG